MYNKTATQFNSIYLSMHISGRDVFFCITKSLGRLSNNCVATSKDTFLQFKTKKFKMEVCMKKFVVVLMCCVGFIFSFGCNDEINSDLHENANNDTCIELNLENYQYYLTLDYVYLGSQSIGYNNVYSYELTIFGAIDGLYVDCVLCYKLKSGNNEKEGKISLNAAGFAKESYYCFNSGGLTITSVSGKIIL